MSTGTAEPTTPAHTARSWERAFGDLVAGWRQRGLWGHLGLQDIKQGYRRSVIGPLWITISMAVTAVALGILYSALFQKSLADFLPYVATGLIVWGFIGGSINEGVQVFIKNEGLIKHLPAPLSVHLFRLVWHQMLLFGHNFAVYLALLAIFRWQLGPDVLLAVPALMLLVINSAWFVTVIGVIATRFRDIPPLTTSIVQLLFFLTPIVWVYEDFANHPVESVRDRARLAELNPFMHFVQIIRQPLLGQDIVARHWVIVGIFTVAGWALALIVLRNYRSRVSYWV